MNGTSGLRRAPESQFWFGEPMPEDAPPHNGHPAAGSPAGGHPTGGYPVDGRRPVEPHHNGHAPQQRRGNPDSPAAPVRRGPDPGPPTGYFAAPDHSSPGFSPVEPDEPRWPSLADSPSLRVPPVHPHPPEAEETSVIPRVPPAPPRVTDPDPDTPDAEHDAPTASVRPLSRAERRRAAEDGLDEPALDKDQPKHGKHRKRTKQPLWRELLTLVAVALLLTFLIQHFIGRVYSIPSGSMEQTLHGCPGCTGDRVFVDKMIYEFRDPLPGDVVVFQGPNSWTGEQVTADGSGDNPFLGAVRYLGSLIGIAPPDERDFVKRVIAIGGQTVECCDEQNRVMVDGKPLDEPYVYWENGGPDERQTFAPVTVPEGTLWVMGDNRGNSADSRIQGGGGIRGVVPITKVIGKVRAIVLPPSRWQGVGDHNPQAPPPIAAPAWQQGVPVGIGIAAAWPVLWIGRRIRKSLAVRTTTRKAE